MTRQLLWGRRHETNTFFLTSKKSLLLQVIITDGQIFLQVPVASSSKFFGWDWHIISWCEVYSCCPITLYILSFCNYSWTIHYFTSSVFSSWPWKRRLTCRLRHRLPNMTGQRHLRSNYTNLLVPRWHLRYGVRILFQWSYWITHVAAKRIYQTPTSPQLPRTSWLHKLVWPPAPKPLWMPPCNFVLSVKLLHGQNEIDGQVCVCLSVQSCAIVTYNLVRQPFASDSLIGHNLRKHSPRQIRFVLCTLLFARVYETM